MSFNKHTIVWATTVQDIQAKSHGNENYGIREGSVAVVLWLSAATVWLGVFRFFVEIYGGLHYRHLPSPNPLRRYPT